MSGKESATSTFSKKELAKKREAASPAQKGGPAPQASSSITAWQQALDDPEKMSPADILTLQRLHGNRAVQRLLANRTLQAKLSVGAAHDPYEQEADRVAAQVMSMPVPENRLSDDVQVHGTLENPVSNPSVDSLQRNTIVQRAAIGAPPHNFTANNSNAYFVPNHVAADVATAETKSKNRSIEEKGVPANTVIIGLDDAAIKALVLAADFDADTKEIRDPIWAVKIQANHVVHQLRVGLELPNTIIDTAGPQVGDVWLKVYFDYARKKVSIMGIYDKG
jgi:hypothetical protein